ncbi:MAG: DUF481 domain-containing protein [Elusimicrobiales bacterium]
MRRFLVSALLASALPGPCMAQFMRADDQLVVPPEYRTSAEKQTLDIIAGSSYLRGNVDSYSVNGGLRYNLKNTLYIDADAMYTEFDRETKLDKARANALYIYSVKPSLNIYGWASYGRNKFLDLKRRNTGGAGVCFHNFMPAVFSQFLLAFGPAYEYALYDNNSDKSMLRANGRINFRIPLGGLAELGGDFIYFGDTADFSDYRIYNETFILFAIRPDKLSFRISLTDEYENRPFAGVKNNDFTMTQSLVVHLGK